MKSILATVLLLLTIIILSNQAYSHTTSTSYLNLNLKNNQITGLWQVTIKDLHLILGLDHDSDSRITWSEIKYQQQEIFSELNKSIILSTENTPCKINAKSLLIDRRVANVYLTIPFESNCLSNKNFSIKYNFLFEKDAFHKSILTITKNKNNQTIILSYANRIYDYNKKSKNSFKHFFEFIIQGIIHVLIGLDHVLFVICLLLSATLLVNHNNSAQYNLKPLISNTFKLITAFTIAHSITLILASTKIVSIPPTIIEPVIALSVIVLALLNLFKNKKIKHWPLVFAFGLIHGFGFAFVLDEVVIDSGSLTSSLFGFNLGVEFGQLIIVLTVMPILYFIYCRKYYYQFIIPTSSIIIAVIGIFWFIERTNNITLM